MGYNGGKRVWPQRNSGLSKSSIRFGYKILRKASLPIIKVGFSAVGLTSNGRSKSYKSSSRTTRISSKIQNLPYSNKYIDNVSSYANSKFNTFFRTSNIEQFSNVTFESMLIKYKSILTKNKQKLQEIQILDDENNLMRKRINSIKWLKLFYRSEIKSLECGIIENEDKISSLKGNILSEYLDFSNYKQSGIFKDLFDLIKSSNLYNSSWLLYPKPNITFQLDVNSLNYSMHFLRSRIQVTKTSIPFINESTDSYICLNNSDISIAFLSCAVIIFTNKSNLAIFNYSDFICTNKEVIIKEDELFKYPKAIVDSWTWLYQKMDGSPDLRYKNNPKVPIVKYSNVTLQTNSGNRLEFLFLNLDFGRLFCETISKMSNDS